MHPEIGRSFNLGFEAAKRDWLTHVGIILVIILLGMLTFHFMTPALFGAYIVMCGASSRGEAISLSGVFDRARGNYLRCWGSALLLGLIIYGLMFAILGVGGLLIAGALFAGQEMRMDQDVIPCIAIGLGAPFMLGYILVQIWLFTRWMFIFPIMVGTGATFSDARATSVRWVTQGGGVLSHFIFSFVANLVAQVGQLLCCVGMFFTIPIGMVMRGSLYQDHLEADGGGKR